MTPKKRKRSNLEPDVLRDVVEVNAGSAQPLVWW